MYYYVIKENMRHVFCYSKRESFDKVTEALDKDSQKYITVTSSNASVVIHEKQAQ